MDELVFATVVVELKQAWNETISDPDLIMLLYSAVAEPLGLTNQNGDPIFVSKPNASKIVNRLPGGNPLKVIRKGSDDKRVRSSIVNFFDKQVMKYLLEDKKDDLIQNLEEAIKRDGHMAESKRNELLSLAQKNTLAKFLASAYLYAIVRNNVIKKHLTRNCQEMHWNNIKRILYQRCLFLLQ